MVKNILRYKQQERHFSGAEYLYLSKPVYESVSDLHFFQYL